MIAVQARRRFYIRLRIPSIALVYQTYMAASRISEYVQCSFTSSSVLSAWELGSLLSALHRAGES